MSKIIIRSYPPFQIKHQIEYRYTPDDFDTAFVFINSNDFTKWKNQINPKTNRKLKICSKVYNKIKYYYDKLERISKLDKVLYLEETDKLKQVNSRIDQYNMSVNEIIDSINNLTKWEEYIDFDGKYYGINSVFNLIHREKDCFGKMIKSGHTSCSCSTCENWNGCGNAGTQHYKCEKCDYLYSNELGTYSRNYKGK